MYIYTYTYKRNLPFLGGLKVLNKILRPPRNPSGDKEANSATLSQHTSQHSIQE